MAFFNKNKNKNKNNPTEENTNTAAAKPVKATKPAKPEKPAKKEKQATVNAKKKKKAKKDIKFLSGLLMKKMAFGGADRLRTNADEVNRLNVFPVPDGDTGDNMRMTIESGIAAIEALDSNDLADVMKVFSHGMLLGARGNSGVILSQFFTGMAEGLENTHKASPKVLGNALEMGVKKAYTSVMSPTEGTILTVARESVEYAVSKITPSTTIRSFFANLAKEMHASLKRTPEMLTALKEAGVVDSGGAGLFYIIDGFNRVLNGEKVEMTSHSDVVAAPVTPTLTKEHFDPDRDMKFGYCTELLVKLQKSKINPEDFDLEAFKEFLNSIGDSVVAFRADDILKLHVHTFTPELVIAKAREYGEFLTVKIENMSLQHTELSERDDLPKAADAAISEMQSEKKKYGIVAVSSGDGIASLFRELSADEVIFGGQTHNPSTNEFISAFENINAENIFVFPNNGNIVMAAEQAAELYDKAKVYVVQSKSMGTGYVALSSVDFSRESAEEIMQDMEEALTRATPGYVSPAIRDTSVGGLEIHNGDTIGVIAKEIVISLPDELTVAKELAEKMLSLDGKFMISVFTGKNVTEEDSKALYEHISSVRPDCEVYFIEGGQEVYPYIMVSE